MKKTNQKIPNVGEFFTITSDLSLIGVRITDMPKFLLREGLNHLFQYVPVTDAHLKGYPPDIFWTYYDDGTDEVIIIPKEEILGKQY